MSNLSNQFFRPELASVRRHRRLLRTCDRKGIDVEEGLQRRALAEQMRRNRRIDYALGMALARAYAEQHDAEVNPLRDIRHPAPRTRAKVTVTTIVTVEVESLFD